MKKNLLDLSFDSFREVSNVNEKTHCHWSFKTSKTIIVFFVVFFVLASSVHAAMVATSDFSSGADGWTWGAPNPSMSWQSSGGDPGGYIRYDNNQGGGLWIYAPSSYLGNWANFGVNELSYQVNIFTTGSVYKIGHLQVSISGPGGDASWVGPQPDPATPWKEIVVPISEASWSVNSGTWSEIMADVTDLNIAMAYYNNWGPFEITGIDNVSLNAVPILSTAWLLASGLFGINVARVRKNKK